VDLFGYQLFLKAKSNNTEVELQRFLPTLSWSSDPTYAEIRNKVTHVSIILSMRSECPVDQNVV
jgi:hypothetical protein